MAQVGNSQDRFGGEYMIQDRDHMGEIDPVQGNANVGGSRQVDQSQANGGQQSGGNRNAGRQQGSQQGGEKRSQQY